MVRPFYILNMIFVVGYYNEFKFLQRHTSIYKYIYLYMLIKLMKYYLSWYQFIYVLFMYISIQPHFAQLFSLFIIGPKLEMGYMFIIRNHGRRTINKANTKKFVYVLYHVNINSLTVLNNPTLNMLKELKPVLLRT